MKMNVVFVFGAIILGLAFFSVNCSSGGGDTVVYGPTATGTGSGSGSGGGGGGTGGGGGGGGTGGGTNTDTYDIKDYLNFAAGNYWKFQSNDGDAFRSLCNGSMTIFGYNTWMVSTDNSSHYLWMDYYTTDTGDLLWLGFGACNEQGKIITFNPPLRFGLASMQVGQQWTDSGTVYNPYDDSTLNYSSTFQLMAVGSVTFQSGDEISDSCLAIQEDRNIDGNDFTIIQYYAPGGGMIQYEEPNFLLKLTESNVVGP